MHDDSMPPNNLPRAMDDGGVDDSDDAMAGDGLDAWSEGDEADDEFAEAESWGDEGDESEGQDEGDELGDEGFAGDEGDDDLDALDDGHEFMRVLRRFGRVVRSEAARRAPQFGAMAGRALGNVVQQLLQPPGFDGFDAFAEVVVASRMGDDELDAFTPALARAGAQRVVAAAAPRRRQPPRGPAVANLAREVRQAIALTVRALVRRHGPAALRALSRILAESARAARQRGTPQALPRTIQQVARRAIASPQAARVLTRARPAVRAALQRGDQGRVGITVPRGARIVAAGARRQGRTIVLQGPVRIILSGA